MVRAEVQSPRSEGDLIRDAKQGDGAAFAELLRPEYDSAIRLACALLHDADEAEDAVQEAALNAWRRLGNLRPGAALRPWLLGIVANQCRTIRRRRWWSATRLEPTLADSAAPDVTAGLDVRRALLRLHDDERLVIALRYYLDLSYDDIAATLGVSPAAVRKRVERAMDRLRPIVQVLGVTV